MGYVVTKGTTTRAAEKVRYLTSGLAAPGSKHSPAECTVVCRSTVARMNSTDLRAVMKLSL